MEKVFRDKIMPAQWAWCIINNIDKFDDKPEFILKLVEKILAIKDHRLLSTFTELFKTIVEFYNKHNKFPDVEWLSLNFKGSVEIQKTTDSFSMQIYESLDKYVEQELIKQTIDEGILKQDNFNLEDIRALSKRLASFSDSVVEMPEETKESLINSYDDYHANFRGVRTHIKPVDNLIGLLGCQSLSVFAAPSGHGKSTFAMSVAYYVALNGGCVDYLSFEIPQNHAWFNMVSIESQGTEHELPSSKMKENALTEEETSYYKEHMTNLLKKIGDAGGYLQILDQTTASISTYEGLCAKLEAVAEKRGRKADLIIVDNIDNFQTLKSSERDESTKINNYIVSLDSFSKTYCNGEGTSILLLSQVNRPAMKNLATSESTSNNEATKKKVKIDVTCVQKYNALYEKATCVLIGYADASARAIGTMRVYPVKLRNRAVPENPALLMVKYGFSKVMGGSIESPKIDTSEDMLQISKVILDEDDLDEEFFEAEE